jgi:hypothetical protein
MDELNTTQVNQPVEPEADGYYGEDEISADEIDLSFLDEEDDAVDGAKAEPITR